MDTINAKNRSLEELLGEVANEFFQRVEQGDRPDVEEYAQRYPEIAEQIRLTFPSLELVGSALSSGDDAGLRTAALHRMSHHRLGDFEIMREIGRGGMGVVYEAQQISMGRRVALKVLPFAALADEMPLRRFRNEVRAVATLDHPNIVSVYSLGEERGIHYYAMQLIRGRSLAEVIEQLAKLKNDPQPLDGDSIGQLLDSPDPSARSAASVDAPTEDLRSTMEARTEGTGDAATTDPELQAAVRTLSSTAPAREFYRSVAKLGIQAASGLAHAHEYGILHRDIKPANLLLDASGKIFITDFGLARIEADAGVTMTGQLIGTLRYMSPEQALAKRGVIDHRSDIYSLGMTLYELLALRPAFDSTSRQKILAQIAFEEPEKLRRLARSIPAELETIVAKAIEKSPEDRYASAAELAVDLRAFLDDRPIAARPPTLVQRLGKWSRRNRGLVAAGAVAGGICFVLLLVSNILIAGQKELAVNAAAGERTERQSAERERDAARQARDQAADVTKFLLDTFQTPDPNRDGHTVTVVEVLDRAVGKLDSQLGSDPLRKRALLDAIALTYGGLGLHLKAVPLFEQALEIARSELGEQHAQTRYIMANLAGAYLGAGQFAEAVELNEQTLKLMQEVLGKQHPDTLRLMNRLASAYAAAGRIAEAVELHEQALLYLREELGERHTFTSEAMNDLALAYRSVGRYEEAVKLLEQTLAFRREVRGERHAVTLQAMNNLAIAYASSHRFEKAVDLLEQTLAIRREVMGERHPETLSAMHNLAFHHQEVGRKEEAVKLLEQTLPCMREVLGERHPQTLLTMGTLGNAYGSVGRFAEAVELLEQTLTLEREVLGERHPGTRSTILELARAYDDVGRFAEAVALHEKLLELEREELGERHPDTIVSMHSIARSYLLAGRFEDAIELNELSLQLMREAVGERHPNAIMNMYTLALAYECVNRFAEAIELHEQTLKLRREVLGQWHRQTLQSVASLARTYHLAGQYAEADKRYDEAIEFLRDPPAETKQASEEIATEHARVLAGGAETSLRLSQPEKAESLARESMELRERFEPEYWGRFHAQSLVGAALLQQGKADEAEQYLLDGFAGMQERKETIHASDRGCLREACQSLVDLYQGKGSVEQAEQWKQSLAGLP